MQLDDLWVELGGEARPPLRCVGTRSNDDLVGLNSAVRALDHEEPTFADIDRTDACRAMQLGDHDATARNMQASTLRCREHGDTFILAHNLFWLGIAAIKRDDMTEAGTALLEAITLKRRFDDNGYSDDALD